jgi:outer membrane protein TolC
MRRILTAVGLPFALVAATAAIARPVRAADAPLRIDDAVKLALAKNEAAQIADYQVDVADAAVEKARVAFLPVIVAAGSDTIRPAPLRANVAPFAITTPVNATTGALTITQPVVNLSAWPLYRQAQRLLDAQRATSTDAKRILQFNAANAFLQTLSQEAVLQAAQRRLDAANANLADTTARAKAQLNSTNDVTRAQVDLAAAQQELAGDVGNVQKAYLSLSFVINTATTGPLSAPTSTLQAAATPVPDAGALVATAQNRRLDLVAAIHAARAAHLFADEPMMRLAPVLGLTGTLSDTPYLSVPNQPVATLAATLTWTIYDAGSRYADKHSRSAQASISDLQLDLLRRQVTNDVHNAVVLLQASQDALKAAASGVASSRKNVDETSVLYRQGLATALDLTTANDSRFEAEIAYSGAEYAMALAYLALRQSMGLDPIGTELR